MSFTPGENVGPYRIVEQLGSGGMATVYKGYHAALDRYVALKVLHPAFKSDANFLARFQREARVVAKLEHPHIVPVYDFNEHKGAPYLVMRFIEGETLKARLERGPLTLPEILDVIRPIGEALTYAHQRGVLHRDIKPSNVILADDGGVFLADFGLARIVQAGESSLTRDAMVGTPFYISPEQAIGKSELDARTDIYSFGVVLYELLTGRVPFKSDTPFAVVHDHIYTPLPLPTSVNPNLPPALERTLLKAMAKEPDDRYNSALELVAAVEESVTGVAVIPTARSGVAPPPARAKPKAEATPPPMPADKATATRVAEAEPGEKRRPIRLLALGGLALLAAVAIVIAAVLLLGNGDRAESQPDTVAQPAPARDLPPQIARGRELAAEGDVEGALAVFETLAQQDPHKIEAYLEAARLLFFAERYEQAAEILMRGVEANPGDPQLHLNLARALISIGDWERAVPEIDWLIENEPHMPEPHAYLGVHLTLDVGDLDAAQEEIDRAFELDPESPEAHFAQGVFHWHNRNFRLARQALEQALESAQSNPWLQERIRFFLETMEPNP